MERCDYVWLYLMNGEVRLFVRVALYLMNGEVNFSKALGVAHLMNEEGDCW